VITELVVNDRAEFVAWLEPLGLDEIAAHEEMFFDRSRACAQMIEADAASLTGGFGHDRR
jgi:hypothetical protein